MAVRIAARGLTDVLSQEEGEKENSRSQGSLGTQEWCENSRGPKNSPIPKELEKKERKKSEILVPVSMLCQTASSEV